MPGPPERQAAKRIEEDLSLPTTGKVQEMLLEHEERLKAHFEKLIDKLLLQRVISDATDHMSQMPHSPQNLRGRGDRHSSKSTKGVQARVPNYVRQLVDGTLTKPTPLGNKPKGASSIENSWSSVEHGARRLKRLWQLYDVSIMVPRP